MRRFDVGFNDPKGILIHISGYGATLAAGNTVPANGTTDYAPGCIFIKYNGTAGSLVYVNQGTVTSCTFVALPDITGIGYDGGAASLVSLITTAAPTFATRLSGTTFLLNLLAGFTTTLPAATGSGTIWKFVVGTVVTSGAYTISAPASTMFGNIVNGLASGGAANTYVQSGGTSIALDALHKGGAQIGDWVQLTDVGVGVWNVTGIVTGTTALATPFS